MFFLSNWHYFLALFHKIIRIFMRFPYDGEKPRPMLGSLLLQRLSLLHQAYRQFPASCKDGAV